MLFRSIVEVLSLAGLNTDRESSHSIVPPQLTDLGEADCSPINLGCCANLHTLTLPHISRSDGPFGTWTLYTLLSVRSTSIQTINISFSVDPKATRSVLDDFKWGALDDILCAAQFSTLIKVQVSLRDSFTYLGCVGPNCADLPTRFIRQVEMGLPRLKSRGILGISGTIFLPGTALFSDFHIWV